MSKRCECDEIGNVPVARLWMYDEQVERPYVNHAPGECKCLNNLHKYRRSDGSVKWLCSNCRVITDVQYERTT